MNLTKNFTLAEMSRSATAIRLGIDNTIPTDLIENARLVCHALEKIRAYYASPIKVTSCYRSGALNKAVGGSKTSDHCEALAVDFEVIGVPNAEVCRAIPAILGSFDQIIYEFGPEGWVHLGLGGTRLEQLTAVKENGKTVYKRGIV